MPEPTRKEIEQKIIKKALTDSAFKEQLLKDPKSALEQMLEVVFPQDLTVQVHMEDANTIHLVLPPISDSGELTDQALDQVAGVEEVGSPRVLRPHAVDEGLDQREAIAGRLARVVVVRPDPAVHVGRPEEDELDLLGGRDRRLSRSTMASGSARGEDDEGQNTSERPQSGRSKPMNPLGMRRSFHGRILPARSRPCKGRRV